MKDATSVITHATKKIADKLADDYEVGLSRMYEILSKDNPYPRAKRLIKAIARHNPSGARQIKADLDAMFVDIFGDQFEEVTAAQLHKEAFEAIDAMLQGRSGADQLQELRELVAIAQLRIEGIERLKEKNALKAV